MRPSSTSRASSLALLFSSAWRFPRGYVLFFLLISLFNLFRRCLLRRSLGLPPISSSDRAAGCRLRPFCPFTLSFPPFSVCVPARVNGLGLCCFTAKVLHERHIAEDLNKGRVV